MKVTANASELKKKKNTSSISAQHMKSIAKEDKNINTLKDSKAQIEDYAITLDIKDNVITELRDTLNNHNQAAASTQGSQNTSNVPFLNELSIQLFWASHDVVFSEENSLRQLIALNDSPAVISIAVPATLSNSPFLRFDIGDIPGFLNIHDIEVKTKSGNPIWRWDKSSLIAKNGLLFIVNNETWPNKMVHLSISIDPQFIVKIDTDLNSQIEDGFIVELLLSSIDASQIDILNKAISPLTYPTNQSEQEILELTDLTNDLFFKNTSLQEEKSAADNSISVLTEQKRILEESLREREKVNNELLHSASQLQTLVETKNTAISNYENEKALLLKNIDTKEAFNQQVINHTEVLNTDKQLLADEITQKNKIIDRVFSEKEILLNDLENKNKIIDKGFSEKEILLNDLENKNKIIDTISSEKGVLLNDLGNKNKIIDKIFSEKTELKKEIDKKEAQLNDLAAKTNLIETEIANNKAITSQLKSETIELSTKKEQLEESLKIQAEKTTTWITENKKKESELIALNKSMVNVLLQNTNLITLSEEKQKHLNQLTSDIKVQSDNYTFLNNQLANSNLDLSSALQTNKLLESTILELKEQVHSFEEAYENKNSFQIFANRLLKKAKKKTSKQIK